MSLENIKEGDELIRLDSMGRRVTYVERLTPTLIITDMGERFRKRDGRQSGRRDRWHFISVRLPREGETQDLYQEARKARLCSRLSRRFQMHELKRLPFDVLVELNNILNQNDANTKTS
ncbi:MAG: hypothetical protein AMS22_06275 [Thiotrichales bacterium SG8_50]|nr:MAG: hypothetical protein AMS22_06275 [Thiotrichales bacterium SG8_50]